MGVSRPGSLSNCHHPARCWTWALVLGLSGSQCGHLLVGSGHQIRKSETQQLHNFPTYPGTGAAR